MLRICQLTIVLLRCLQSPEALSVGCIDLACKFHSIDVDSALSLKYSLCKTSAAYSKMIGNLQQMLGLQSIIGTKELAIQFGCIQANDLARKVLQSYKEKVRASIPGVASSDSASSILDSRNSYPAVAFYLSCRHLKITGVDRKRLLSSTGVTEKEFLAVADSFYQHIPELKPPERAPRTNKKLGGIKRKVGEALAGEKGEPAEMDRLPGEADEQVEQKSGEMDEETFDDEDDIDMADASSNPALAGSKRLEHERWKQRIAAEAKEDAKILKSITKKRKTDAASMGSTSASPAADAAIATAFLRQSKLSFGGRAFSKHQLESTSDGEAEY